MTDEDAQYRDGLKMFNLQCRYCRESEALDLEKLPTEQAKAFLEHHIEKCEDGYRKLPTWVDRHPVGRQALGTPARLPRSRETIGVGVFSVKDDYPTDIPTEIPLPGSGAGN